MLDWTVNTALGPNPEVIPDDSMRETLTEVFGYLGDTLEQPFIAVALEHTKTEDILAVVTHSETEGQYDLLRRSKGSEKWRVHQALPMTRLARKLADLCFNKRGYEAAVYDQLVIHRRTGVGVFSDSKQEAGTRALFFDGRSPNPEVYRDLVTEPIYNKAEAKEDKVKPKTGAPSTT
jgi:hypothetical protein